MKKISVMGSRGILDDSSLLYLRFLQSVIDHADPDAKVHADKKDDRIDIIVTPSQDNFKKALVKDILFMHSLMGIKSNFSKSTKVHKKLFFYIENNS